MAWGVGHIGLPFSEDGQISALGIKLPLPADTTFVASVRYQGAIHLRVEEIAANEAEAQHSTLRRLSSLLGMFKALGMAQESAAGTPEDKAVRDLVNSIQVEQKQERTVVTANLPAEALRRMTQ